MRTKQMKLNPILLSALVLACLLGLVFPAQALEPTDKWEGLIDYAATGASLLDDTCSLVQDDNDFDKLICKPLTSSSTLQDRDFQGDTALTESDSFMGGVPADVHVVKAILVWNGSVNPIGGQPDPQVTFTPPGGKDYVVVAETTDLQETTFRNEDANTGVIQNWRYYTYRVDITELMRDHHITNAGDLNGFYKFSDYQGYAGAPYIWNTMAVGGWSMILIYADPMADPKRVFYYTDFQYTSNNVLTQKPSGFEVPEDATAKVTLFISEGDYPLWGMCYGMEDMDYPTLNTGDFIGTPAEICSDYLGITHTEGLFFNGEILDDGCFPSAPPQELTAGLWTPSGENAENVYNSTVNTNLNPSEGSCRINTYSIDLDTFDVSSLLNFKDTEATIEMSLGSDFIFTNFLILSISTKLPDFDIPGEPEKSASIEPGGSVRPGEEFTYYIYIENNGEDFAENVRVRDILPDEVTYVPNSTVVVEPDGTRRSVPDPQGGLYPSYTGIAIADSMDIGPDYRYTVEMTVRLKSLEQGISKESIVDNLAEIISGNGDIYFTNGGVPITHRVRLEAFEGELYIAPGKHSPGNRFVTPGQKDVVISQVNLKALEDNVRLVSFTFSPTSDSDPTLITGATLYWDRNNDGKLDDGDVQLGDQQTWGTVGMVFGDFSDLEEISANEQENLLLTVDIAENARPDAFIQLELLSEHVQIQGFANGLPMSSARLTVPGEDVDLIAELGPNNPGAGYLQIGSQSPVMQLHLRALGHNSTLASLTVDLQGTLYDPQEVPRLFLVNDANGNGVYDTGEPVLGDQVSPASDDSSVTFTRFFLELPIDTDVYVLLVGEFAQSITEEKTFRVSISGNDKIGCGESMVAGAPIEGSLFIFAKAVYECMDDVDCDPLGFAWTCDLLAGICRSNGTGADGDDPNPTDGDLPTDGDFSVDGDEDGSGASSGGCNGSGPLGAGVLLLFGLMISLMLRRREN
jgi:uncharacterized repeat protein (TIGR01451 family)